MSIRISLSEMMNDRLGKVIFEHVMSDSERFDTLISAVSADSGEKLYYHEMVGILTMHANRLCSEAFAKDEESQSDDSDESPWIGL